MSPLGSYIFNEQSRAFFPDGLFGESKAKGVSGQLMHVPLSSSPSAYGSVSRDREATGAF